MNFGFFLPRGRWFRKAIFDPTKWAGRRSEVLTSWPWWSAVFFMAMEDLPWISPKTQILWPDLTMRFFEPINSTRKKGGALDSQGKLMTQLLYDHNDHSAPFSKHQVIGGSPSKKVGPLQAPLWTNTTDAHGRFTMPVIRRLWWWMPYGCLLHVPKSGGKRVVNALDFFWKLALRLGVCVSWTLGLLQICVQCIFLVPEIGVRDQAPWKAMYVSELCK